jgi:hypothetical protein
MSKVKDENEAIRLFFDDDISNLNLKKILELLHLNKKITPRCAINLKSMIPDTPLCDIPKIESEIHDKKNELKKLNEKLRKCKTSQYKYGRENISMNELLILIKRENKDSVSEFLELFPTTSERDIGIKVTRNHVFEALWIISYLRNLDDVEKQKQFYKSLEDHQIQSYEEVLGGPVNSGNQGGIADIYFELKGNDGNETEGPEKLVQKVTCGPSKIGDYPVPHCENTSIKSYNKYLFSSKFYSKTKGVGNYDIAEIFTEAISRGLDKFNIILLVQDKGELERKMDSSNKSLSNLCHNIYDINDLNKYYKLLLYQEKRNVLVVPTEKQQIEPRFHQKYFIDYSCSCMKKYKTKNFIWGAVPRSGKSFMIGGLIAKVKPKCVLLYLGAITETKQQFIDMFRKYEDFSDYEIHDCQNKTIKNRGKSKVIIIFSQEKNRMDVKKSNLPPIIQKTLTEKDKLIFFDEIHQGSGESSLQETTLNTVVFENPYKAFIMVTATFAKPYLKYINKGELPGRLIQWRYDDIQLMKTIHKTIIDDTGEEILITYEKIKQTLIEEDDGDMKLEVFNTLIQDYNEQGINLEDLAKQYEIYPELIVSTPIIDENVVAEFSDIIVNGNISVDKIFKPLMKKTPTDEGTAMKYIEYIRKYIYEKYIMQTLNQGATLRKPHSELWFLPTIFRSEKGPQIDEDIEEIPHGKKKGIPGFRYMTQNFTRLLMEHPWFKENYCVIILHSVGFDSTEVQFLDAQELGGKKLKWNDLDVQHTGNSFCISTTCVNSKSVKDCILKQEACAKANGKSVIILTGKMLRLGVSLPCVDIALHMDPIKSVDTIYQSMFRVLTEREGKQFGIFVDMLTTRQITFMYEYVNYANTNILTTQKKIKQLLEKLLLWNFNGISFQRDDEYKSLYDKLMDDFSLNDIENFQKNTQKIDKSEVSELVRSFDESQISDLHSLLKSLGIDYKSGKKKAVKKSLKKRKGAERSEDDYRNIDPSNKPLPVMVEKNPTLKKIYNEVTSFLNDMIVLFALFSSDNYEANISKEEITMLVEYFFAMRIEDIQGYCDEIPDETLGGTALSVIDCHLMKLIKAPPQGLTVRYNELKGGLKQYFETILQEDSFYKIFVSNIEDMKKLKKMIKNKKQVVPCSDDFIKDEKVLEIIRKRLTVREEEKNLYGEVFTPIELICEMFSHIPDEVWMNPDLKWLDPANGIGNFPVVAYYKLLDSLKGYKPKGKSLSKYIIEDMLYMVELNPVNVRVCRKIFKMIDPDATPNIVKHDFLTFKGFKGIDKFDVIMGNPPFNYKAKNDNNFYVKFIKKINDSNLLNLLLAFIIPNRYLLPLHEANLELNRLNTLVTNVYVDDFKGISTNIGWVISDNSEYKGKTIGLFNGVKYNIDLNIPTPTNSGELHFKVLSDKILNNNKPKIKFIKKKDVNKKEGLLFVNRLWKRFSPLKTKGGDHVFQINIGDDGRYIKLDKYPEKVLSWYLSRSNVIRFISKLYASNSFVPTFMWYLLPEITSSINSDRKLYKYFNLTPDDIKIIEDYIDIDSKSSKSIEVDPPSIKQTAVAPVTSVQSKRETPQPKVKAQAKPTKTKCSKLHPEPPCPEDKPRIKNDCCYKNTKTKKKKASPQPKVTAKAKPTKTKCSKLHPEPPCPEDKPRIKNDCCYKNKTTKKKGGGWRRKNKKIRKYNRTKNNKRTKRKHR